MPIFLIKKDRYKEKWLQEENSYFEEDVLFQPCQSATSPSNPVLVKVFGDEDNYVRL
jgi:hypothetical protein